MESFKPGYLASLGLGHGDLAALKPDIVLTSVTPYGQTGPDTQTADGDLVLMARGGLLNLCGEADGPPARLKVPQAYTQGAAQAAMASAFALYHAERTGAGQHVDVSIQDAIANSLLTEQQS